ncbi:MAG: hypothetical protein RR744_09885 [Cellulosilyticaceae bacterium]
MKEKKSCNNCKYINCFVDGHGIERRYCTNESYLEARANFKSTGRAHCYCTWYEQTN